MYKWVMLCEWAHTKYDRKRVGSQPHVRQFMGRCCLVWNFWEEFCTRFELSKLFLAYYVWKSTHWKWQKKSSSSCFRELIGEELEFRQWHEKCLLFFSPHPFPFFTQSLLLGRSLVPLININTESNFWFSSRISFRAWNGRAVFCSLSCSSQQKKTQPLDTMLYSGENTTNFGFIRYWNFSSLHLLYDRRQTFRNFPQNSFLFIA